MVFANDNGPQSVCIGFVYAHDPPVTEGYFGLTFVVMASLDEFYTIRVDNASV